RRAGQLGVEPPSSEVLWRGLLGLGRLHRLLQDLPQHLILGWPCHEDRGLRRSLATQGVPAGYPGTSETSGGDALHGAGSGSEVGAAPCWAGRSEALGESALLSEAAAAEAHAAQEVSGASHGSPGASPPFGVAEAAWGPVNWIHAPKNASLDKPRRRRPRNSPNKVSVDSTS
ncbi:unnamed protein product, partial [Durusdinium trenchii]